MSHAIHMHIIMHVHESCMHACNDEGSSAFDIHCNAGACVARTDESLLSFRYRERERERESETRNRVATLS